MNVVYININIYIFIYIFKISKSKMPKKYQPQVNWKTYIRSAKGAEIMGEQCRLAKVAS